MIRQYFIKFYQNLVYIPSKVYLKQQITMFGVAPTTFSLGGTLTVPTSPDAHKLIEAIRDQTSGVPTNLVFVLDIVSVRFGGYLTPQIKAEIQRFPYLQMLTLNDCGIKSLQNFPHLPGLIRLDLVFNQITGESLQYIKGSRHLQTLMLGANKIQKFEHLQQLGSMRQLLQLDLINNPVSKLAGYRQKMFSLFPTISILDTLDKAGKDAYSNSSMALTISRVPDTLFDKSAPIPVMVPVPPASIPARTSSISKSVVPAVAPKTTIAASTLPIRTTSRLSSKSKTDIKPLTISKKGKTGKAGKTASIKSRSSSARAGLMFPVARLKRRLKQSMPSTRIAKGSSVYMAAVLEYLAAELLEGAGNIAKNDKKRRITPSILKRSLKADQELHKMLNGITFSMGQ